PNICRIREFCAAPERIPVEYGNHGHWQGVDAFERPGVDALERVRSAALAQLRNIGAGGEGAALAAQHERARTLLERFAQRVQCVDQLLIDGIALLGPLQRRDDELVAILDQEWCVLPHRHTRSMMVAVPCPTPTHLVARPYREPSHSMRFSNVTSRREPDDPSGCPSAMAPPSAFTRAGSSPRRRMQASDCEANASLSSIEPSSSTVSPARSSAFSVAGTGPRPITSGAS